MLKLIISPMPSTFQDHTMDGHSYSMLFVKNLGQSLTKCWTVSLNS